VEKVSNLVRLALFLGSFVSGISAISLTYVAWLRTKRKDLLLFAVQLILFAATLLAKDVVSFLSAALSIAIPDQVFWSAITYFVSMVAFLYLSSEFMQSIVSGSIGVWLGRSLSIGFGSVPLVGLAVMIGQAIVQGDSREFIQIWYGVVVIDHMIFLNFWTFYAILNLRQQKDPFRRAFAIVVGCMAVIWDPVQFYSVVFHDGLRFRVSLDLTSGHFYFFFANILMAIIIVLYFFLGRGPGDKGGMGGSFGPIAEQLSPREREVLALMTSGLLNKEIAGELGIAENTVKNHLYSAYRKLGVTNRTGAVRMLGDHSPGVLGPH
jgi:DNA-binding CsgD family transcriptional regulator